MSLDPLSGLDPTAPATTLQKDVVYTYTPPPGAPATTPESTSSYSNGQAGYTYYLVDENGVERQVTFSEYINATGGY